MMPHEIPMKAPFAPASVLPQTGEPPRPPVAAARRLVVKLGTRVLTEPDGELDRESAGGDERGGEADARVRDGARRDGIDYALMSVADPPEHALRSFLLPRAAAP